MRQNHQPNQQVAKLVFLVGFARWGSHFIHKNCVRTSRQITLIFLLARGNPLSKPNGWQPKKMKNTHEHPWAMSTREFTWTPLSFINDAADKLGFGQWLSHFFIYYFVLHLLVSFFFLFLVFHPVLAWRSQQLSIAIVAKHVFSSLGMSENEVTFFPLK